MNDAGATLLTPTFITVGSTTGKPTFGNFIPMTSDGVASAYSIEIQGLNSDGSTDWDFNYAWDGQKWIDYNSMEDASSVEIAQGKGLWTYNNTGAKVTFQCSGQVGVADVALTLNDSGATAIGNCFPVNTAWGDVSLVAAEGNTITPYSIEVQGLNNDGTTNWDYNYAWDGEKWIDYGTMADATNCTIPAGMGLWIYNNTGAGVTIQIAAPDIN